MTPRETAERHAQDVVDGNLERIIGDFEESAFSEFMALGVTPPQPTTEWTIFSETPDGDLVRFHVRYANDNDHLELKTTWRQIDGAWKIVAATTVA
jgi:hypothetical protein